MSERCHRLLLSAPVVLAAISPALACGTERWPVKTATDRDATQVAMEAKPATIDQLRAMPAPAEPNSRPAARFAPVELTTYMISGILTVIKREADEDYHLVLADPNNPQATMIVEAPSPHCAAGSGFLADITATRATIEQELGPIAARRQPNLPVTVTGIAFFDILHGQEGVAPNGIELHPLRSIRFDAGRSSGVKCGPFTQEPLPKPVPQTDPEAAERFNLINSEIKSRPYRIMFLGDSLIQKWNPPIWNRYFAPRGALNEGVNGDRTEHLLWRLEHGNLDGLPPRAIVLLIGTNDIGRNRPAEIIAEDIRKILIVLRSRFPAARVLLLGILPRSEWPNSKRRYQVSEVNDLIRTCADTRHIFYANFGDALLDHAGRLTRAISPDGVHLSEEGYALLALRLKRGLDAVLGKELVP